nr:serine/threonine-protein phosphatase 7 long form homolog [Ipomoea batatas]
MSRRYLHPGPIDSSLLTFQVHHRSESVWANREYNSLLSCAHYASAAACRNVVSNDRIERLLREAGFLAITRLGYMKLDHHLITALVERWRPEVHAFHLPFGEVTITLQDVEVLLGLKVDGRPVIGKIDQSKLVRFAQIENLLGFTPNQDGFNSTVLKITSLERHVAAFDVLCGCRTTLMHYRNFVMMGNTFGQPVSHCFISLLWSGTIQTGCVDNLEDTKRYRQVWSTIISFINTMDGKEVNSGYTI